MSKTWEFAYLDDHTVVQRLPACRQKCYAGHAAECAWCNLAGPPPDGALLDQSVAAYEREGLARNLGKAYRYETSFEVLGSHVAGHAGIVSVHLDKRRQVFRLATSFLCQKRVCQNELESLVGNFICPFLHNRTLMTIFEKFDGVFTPL